MLQSGIPAWIKDNDLPTGYIFVPESWEESNASSKFKIKILQQLITDGWNIVAAYGDSSTDFEAYSAVGIPETSIYALKREGDDKCQTGIWSKCLDGWK